MSRTDHHDRPFDDGTQIKLFIYESYVQAWLQVFIHTSKFQGRPLQFFDYFAGPGQDLNGMPGSPVILMDELERHRNLIVDRGRTVAVTFNDHEADKAEALRGLCQAKKYKWQPTILAEDFVQAYARTSATIGQAPSLVFLDQMGVKYVTKQIFTEIAAKPQTDLLFFFASAHQRRFSEQFANELNVPTNVPHTQAHRLVADHYRQWAPPGYFVGHFSIMKGSNVYGLIFGSGHSLGMFKFLQIAWGVDPKTGEANFPIEAECDQGELGLGFKKTKLEVMQEELIAKITARTFTTDAQVAIHCISGGVLPTKVAPDVYKKLKTAGILAHSRDCLPRASYDAVNDPRPLVFAKP